MGNAVGSLTQVQHEIIVGSMLGDGTLRRQGARKHPLFEVNHSVRYKSYVDWKYNTLKDIVLTPPKARRTNGRRIAYRFTTRSLPLFDKLYGEFYSRGKKSLPDSIELTPLTLAVWFMDDGSATYNSYYLNTQQFSRSEQEKLLALLLLQWEIEGGLNRDKCYYRIRILAKSAYKFRELVSPYVLPIFRYKLGNDPVTTDPKGEALVTE